MWGYKLQTNLQICFHFFCNASLTYSSNLRNPFSCSDDTINMQSISNPLVASLLSIPTCRSPSFPLFQRILEKMHWLRHTFKNMPNSFSVFIFTCSGIPIMRRFIFITGIQNFSKFRLPRALKKVEATKAKLDFKFIYNQLNFFICVSNNHFIWKYFVCFVLCIYSVRC